jgi:peptidoglycan/LPS O-acetylase OafA/YrhL
MAQDAVLVQTGPPAPMPYIPALDGLRAISILLVVLSHLGLDHMLPGAFGVTLFFFISGYLITRQLLQLLYAKHHVGLGGFYLRRALRLMPMALVYILVTGLLYRMASGQIAPLAWLTAIFYGANYYALWSGYSASLPDVRHPFNILWSLAIEEHFYLVWPCVLGMVWRRAWLPWALLAVCGSVLAWRWILFDSCFYGHAGVLCAPINENPVLRYNQLYLSTDTRLDSIVWGALLAVCEVKHVKWFRPLIGRVTARICACLLLAFSFETMDAFNHYVFRTTLQGEALLILIPALLQNESRLRRLLSSRAVVALGRVSYALYLWHWGALAFADWAAPGNHLLWLAVAAPLSALLATLAYFSIERPCLYLRRWAGSRAPIGLMG